MVSKKARQQQRARHKRLRQRQNRDPLIGYYAHDGPHAVCDGDGLIVAASEADMRRILERRLGSSSGYAIRGTTFCEVLAGIRQGGAYCFDEQAYNRFRPPAREAGMMLGEEDFSDPGPLGMHFVRVQDFATSFQNHDTRGPHG